MALKKVKIRTTSRPGGRAWPGDVGNMQLDISKVKMRGWRPKLGSEEAIRQAAGELVQELK
jgi:UDP-glucose 4-epimerase